MAIVKCLRGHYYDNEKYDECPMCVVNDIRGNKNSIEDEHTMPLLDPAAVEEEEEERTVGINFKENKCDPVVGWLVCLDGDERGRDFRIHSGRNFVGRDLSNDIAITYDGSLSRKNAGYIIYEPHKNQFIALNGEGASITVNGIPAFSPCVLTEQADIVIGTFRYAFVAYCKEGKKW